MGSAKITICEMGQEGNFTYVILQKNKHFFSWLAKLLFRSFKFYDVDTYDFENKKGQWKTRKKQIKDFTDKHEAYYSPRIKERVDIFYGKNKIFLTLIAPKESKKKFLDILEDISKWTTKKATFKSPF